MTRRIQQAIRLLIIELINKQAAANEAAGLGRKANAAEAQRQLRALGYSVGTRPILDAMKWERILPQGGRQKGVKMPGVGGRPRGEGKKFSTRRPRAIELRQQPELSLRDIARIMSEEGEPISPEGVRKLLLSDGDTKKIILRRKIFS